MKLVITSDLHGSLPDIPECDLLLINGDVCPVENHDRKYQATWLRGEFYDWMRQQPAKMTVWVGGNHDFALQDWRYKRDKIAQLPGLYLDNNWLELYPNLLPDIDWPEDKPLKIWGSPMSNRFGGWAFMASETDLSDLWKTIPRDIDILMVHGPMFGIGDAIPAVSWSAEKRGWSNLDEAEHVGSTSLRHQLEYEEWPNLKMVVSGHIHEAYGIYTLKDSIPVYNVSLMDGSYNPVNPVMEVTLNAESIDSNKEPVA